MKRRWSILFWLSLATLIGMSWLTATLGVDFTSLLGVGVVGMIAAAVVAFAAMHKGIERKWPAAVVLACAGPFGIDAVRVVGDLAMLASLVGPSIVVVILGNIATIVAAIIVLAARPPAPPTPPPIAPARAL